MDSKTKITDPKLLFGRSKPFRGKKATGPKDPLIPCRVCSHRVKQSRMKEHIRRVHDDRKHPSNRDRTLDFVVKPSPVPAPASVAVVHRPKTSCPRCGLPVFADCLDRHLGNCAYIQTMPRSRVDPRQFVNEYPFEILPPGTGEWKKCLRVFLQDLRSRGLVDELEIDRFSEIEALGPIWKATGKLGWRGYAVFGFHDAGCVLVDSPVRGNAAYILNGDWKKMIHLNKARIRDQYRGQYVKVVHKNNWVHRIALALRDHEQN